VGYGNFAAALWLRQPPEMAAYPIYQPVHSAPLLAAAELGLPGALLWLALAAGPWLMLWARRRGGAARPLAPLTIAAAGAVAALTAISLFDFYPWFSQQGRTLLWILWGLFAQGMIHVDVTRAA
jgi:O-antigen ligase